MSTKIHNGYRINTDDLSVVYKELLDFGESVVLLAGKLYSELYYSMAINFYDRITLKTIKPSKSSCSFLAWEELAERQRRIRATQQRDPLVDFECTIVLYPMQGFFLIRLITEQPEFVKLFESNSMFESYCYWNNTDRPESLTEEEWKEREENWEEIFNRRHSIHGCGLIFEAIEVSGLSQQKEFFRTDLMTVEQRAREEAWNRCFKAKIEADDLDPETMRPSDYIRFQREATESKEIDKYIAEVVKELKPVVEFEDLHICFGDDDDKS